MSTHIDKVYVDVSGLNVILLVQKFTLDVAINAIPTLSLEVLPIEDAARGRTGYSTASVETFSSMTALYQKMTAMTKNLETKATVGISIVSESDAANESQDMTFKDWILSDVGMSSVTSYSAPILTVVLSHPAKILDSTGMIYEKLKMMVASYDNRMRKAASEAKGTVNMVDKVYDLYKNGMDFYPIGDKKDGGADNREKKIAEAFRTSILYAPGNYIDCPVKNLFMKHLLGKSSGLVSNLELVLAKMSAPEAFGGSTWNRLLSSICPQTMMSILPSYDKDKLVMYPSNPWDTENGWVSATGGKSGCIKFDNSCVQAIDMVTIDPSPIIGVAIDKITSVSAPVHGGAHRDNSKLKEDGTFSFFFPTGVNAGDLGTILSVHDSQIIDDVNNMPVKKKDQQGGSNNYSSISNGIPLDKLKEIRTAYGKAMFLQNYRKYCKASVTTIPMFKDIGERMIYPGCVATVTNPDDGTNLFYGYITRMTVSCSANGGGSSMFEMMYARPSSGDPCLVKEGTKNPCYEY